MIIDKFKTELELSLAIPSFTYVNMNICVWYIYFVFSIWKLEYKPNVKNVCTHLIWQSGLYIIGYGKGYIIMKILPLNKKEYQERGKFEVLLQFASTI